MQKCCKNRIKLITIIVLVMLLLLSLLLAEGNFDDMVSTQATNDDSIVNFSHDSGIYASDIEIRCFYDSSTFKIYYTLDGNIPNSESILYKEPINLTVPKKGMSVVPLRIAVYRSDEKITEYKKTYIMENGGTNTYGLNVACITTDNANLYDYYKGILVEGVTFARKGYTAWGDRYGNYSNKGKKWTKPATIYMFSKDNECLINDLPVDLSVVGGSSRGYDVKSLKISAKEGEFIEY